MATTPTIVIGRNNWGIKNGNLLGYYQSDDGFFVKREFTATRGGGTNGTFVGSNGLIQTAASGNLPRIDFYGGLPALLVEPSAQNIMAQSETLSVSGNWSRTFVLVSGGAIASPDGLASGTLIVATSGSNTHWIERNAATTVTSGTAVTTSCFFKAHGTNTFAQLVIGNIGFSPASPFANFNLTGSGSVTAGNYTSAFIQNYGNGWYRCGFTTTAAGNGTAGINICPILASGTGRATTFTGDGVNGVYAWGAQVETGSVPTSYIPTTTGSVTRNADLVNLTGATDYIGQTEGTLYAEFTWTGKNGVFRIDDGTNNNTIALDYINDTSQRFRISGSGAAFVNIATTNFLLNTTYKVACAYKSTDSTMYVNGTPIASSNGSFTFNGTLSRIFLSESVSLGVPVMKLSSFAIYNKRLPNDQLQALTTL